MSDNTVARLRMLMRSRTWADHGDWTPVDDVDLAALLDVVEAADRFTRVMGEAFQPMAMRERAAEGYDALAAALDRLGGAE